MKVALDAQLSVGTSTGIGEYVQGLLQSLPSAGVALAVLREPRLNPWRFDRRILWDQVLLPARAARSGAELLHCASGTMPRFCKTPIVTTVHDVAWLKVQTHARSYARYYFGRITLASYKRARLLLVDSRFSRNELLSVYDGDPNQVIVIYPGVAPDFAAVQRRRVPQATVLVVGTVERRKNLEVIIRALPQIRTPVHVLVAGPPTPYLRTCQVLAQDLGVAERMQWLGYVTRAQLLQLYATSTLAVVPSAYEGFGYAVAQALVAGVPVISSNAASLPEVAQGDAPLLDPHDAQTWAVHMQAVLDNPDHSEEAAQARRVSAAARFSLETAARALKDAYARALVNG